MIELTKIPGYGESPALKESEKLQELRHRVKNSLAVLSSLITLERNKINDPETTEALNRIKNKIFSISELYNLLNLDENSDQISLDRYLMNILGSLKKSYLINTGDIEITGQIEPVFIDAKRAASIGLITNELVTYSLLNGLIENSSGIINISLKTDIKNYVLTLSDNGSGLPEGFDPQITKSTGIKLLITLTEQLNGTIHWIDDNGLTVKVVFPV